MSFDTKYRPKAYSDVLGQKGAIRTLKGLVSSGAGWNQSYLFAGPWGSGKTTVARVLARALLCEAPREGEPCDACGSCLSMLGGSSDAFVEVDAATNSGKADVKKILEEIDYMSFAGRRKLYLFDEAHQLSKDALDALLKPMEENRKGSPEKRLVCIFATTEPEKMRATVLSRCAPAFIIHHVDSEDIADRLAWVCDQESISYEREALLLIADFSEGHIRDALKAVEGVSSGGNKAITLSGVRSYLHVDRNDQICEVLVSDSKRALSLSEDILQSAPAGVAIERLLTATMFAISLGMGTGEPPPYWNKEVLVRAWDKYGLQLLSLAESLSEKPKKATPALFKCEVLKWKMSAEGQRIIPPTPTRATEPQIVETAPKPIEIKESVEKEEEMVELSLMEFAKVVNRYKKSIREKGETLGDTSETNKLGGPRDNPEGGGGS